MHLRQPHYAACGPSILSCTRVCLRQRCLYGGLVRGSHPHPHHHHHYGGGPLVVARRWARVGRAPTFQEITEALAVLGCSIDEDPKTLKRRYRELVKKNHPDAGGDAAKMARITVCYDRLEGLSKREREEFKLQQRMYSGGGVPGSRAAHMYRTASNQHRYAAPGAGTAGASADEFYHHRRGFEEYYKQGGDPFAQARAHQQAYNNYYHNNQRTGGPGGGGFGDNPFGVRSPFSIFGAGQRARFLSPGGLLLQAIGVYLVCTIIFMFAYRRYRDYRNIDGWKMSEEYARHEQMQEAHRLRKQMSEQREELLRQYGGDPDAYARALEASGGGGGARSHAGPLSPMEASLLYRRNTGAAAAVASGEERALEYARMRRIQQIEEERRQTQAAMSSSSAVLFAGWPTVDDAEGRLIKRAQDPLGVVFFEPNKSAALHQQIKNRTRGMLRDEEAQKSREQAEQAAAQAAAQGPQGPQTVQALAAQLGLPPEQNVGAVKAFAVDSNADARSAMETILSAFRSAQPSAAAASGAEASGGKSA